MQECALAGARLTNQAVQLADQQGRLHHLARVSFLPLPSCSPSALLFPPFPLALPSPASLRAYSFPSQVRIRHPKVLQVRIEL